MLKARGLFRRLWCFVVVVLMLLVVTGGAFAQGSSAPSGATVAPMTIQSGTSSKDAGTGGGPVLPQNTVYGDAGYSWIYTTRVAYLQAQAGSGATIYSSYPPMAFVSWIVSWGDGQSTSGTAFPFSRTWSGQSLHKYASSGWYTTMLSGYAILTDGTKAVILNPTSLVYVY